MRADPATARSTGLAATATTLVAVVAMVASASAAPAAQGRAAPADPQRASISVASMRAMAAAAAAMARNVLGSEQQLAAHPPLVAAIDRMPPPGRAVETGAVAAVVLRCGPRLSLLDLPPPRC